ncbi:MAG: 4-carboxy-4-hydroxy-2-oxoadipate aldolase/oxaloacetate decarboxylase [Candidatus Marinimicrobia bacterium]|nr:4-carboxy-4-hydroxy-2-oxoadipate aldolase/oxaloacetate decarboxylase [Candidatus Neomarinimicrobiota bacterium]
MIHVYTQITRPDTSLVEAFRNLAAATVYEAAGRIGSVSPRIKPIAEGMKIVGTAITVQCKPKDNLMLHKALQIAQPGDIIVADTDGYYDAGYWGDLMACSAVARKLGGLAIDGCIRDSEEIIKMGFPVFSRGTCMRGTIKSALGTVNHPIIFGEVVVHPGDLILGDDDGIVVIPRQDMERVLQATIQRVKNEVEKANTLATGISSVEFNKLDKVFELLGLVEE